MPCVGTLRYLAAGKVVFGVRERRVCLAVWSYLVSELGNGTWGPGTVLQKGEGSGPW